MSDEIIDATVEDGGHSIVPRIPIGEALVRLDDFDEERAAAMLAKRERTIDRIRHMALRQTRAQDWQDFDGKPMLQATGCEKLQHFFGVSFDRPTIDKVDEQDGSTRFVVSGQVRSKLTGQEFFAVGERSTAEPFFTRNERRHPSKTIADVKQAAISTWERVGISRMLGIRNLSWADIEEMTGFKQSDCGKVAFNRKAGAAPVQETKGRAAETKAAPAKAREESSTLDDKKNQMRSWLLTMCGNDPVCVREMMREITTDPEGKYPPKDSVDALKSDKQVGYFYSIIKKRYTEWEATCEPESPTTGDLDF